MKSFIVLVGLFCTGAVCLGQGIDGGMPAATAIASPQQPGAQPYDCTCGNVDCLGGWNMGDAYYLFDYLFRGGPPPLTPTFADADWDNHQLLTVNDVWWIIYYVFGEGPGPICPPGLPSLTGTVDAGSHLYYTDRVRAGDSQAAITLVLKTDSAWTGLTFPIRIRIEGQIPVIDSIVFRLAPYSQHLVGSSIYADSGCAAIGATYEDRELNPEGVTVATLYVAVLPSADERHVALEWENLSPVQAPVPDNSIAPMLTFYNQCLEPVLMPHCCIVAGDVNDDGAVDLGDAVFIMNYIFRQGSPPPCDSQGDANSDGQLDSGDAVYIVNFIFRDGPAPLCL